MRREIALARHPSRPGYAIGLTVLRAPVLQPSHMPVALSPTYHREPGIQPCRTHFFQTYFRNNIGSVL